jgi:hypothetical protein
MICIILYLYLYRVRMMNYFYMILIANDIYFEKIEFYKLSYTSYKI